METYEQKRRRLFGKLQLSEYLEELNKLINVNITEKDLLSIVETDNFLEKHRTNNPLFFKETIPFSRKDILKEILKKNIEKWDKPYIFYSGYSESCGILKIPSLNCFNLNFRYEDEHSGFFTFNSKDGNEKIYFDFYKEDEKEFLEITIYRK